jgi:uncharacterized OsmC-like protein
MKVEARYLGGVKFEVAARNHRLICDQPQDMGGTDAGITPPEFLLAALATCAGYYAVQYLNARSLPAENVSVQVSAEKATQPARLASFRIEVTTPDLDPRHEAGVLRAVKNCLIHNTLLNSPAMEVSVNATAAATQLTAA